MAKGKSLVSFFVPALLISVALFCVVGVALYYFGIQQPLANQARQLMSSQLNERSKLVQQRIDQVQDIIELVAAQTADKSGLLDINVLAKAAPSIENSQIFDEQQIEVNLDSEPQITHATVDLLRRGFLGEKIQPELILQSGEPRYVAFVQGVGEVVDGENKSGELIKKFPRVLLATINTKTLAKMMGDPPEGSTLVLRQHFSGSEHKIVGPGVSLADLKGEPLIESQRFGADWSLALWQNNGTLQNTGMLPIILGIGAFLALLIAALMPYMGLSRILGQDARHFIKSINSGKVNSNFKIDFFNELAASYRRVASDKMVDDEVFDNVAIDEFTPERDSSQNKVSERMDVDLLAVAKMINPNIFREYDIRGIAGKDLSEQVIFALGKSIGSEAYARGEQKIVVARDGRLSSPEFHKALIQGLVASGRDIIDLGMVPTPVLYFATKELDSNSGVMLTGSHNPAMHNGLKIVLSGETLYGRDIQALFKRIKENDLLSGKGQVKSLDFSLSYLEKVVSKIQLERPLKVAVDCGNGVTGQLAPQMLQALGCEVIGLYTEIDGEFPNHHPDPNDPANLQDLIKMVQKESADVGLAFDGDGDRLGVVDNNGKIIWTDRVMMLFAMDVLSRNTGADVLFDVKCSNHLAETIRNNQGNPVMWKTGHSLMKAKMREIGAILGGEGSGHLYFQEDWNGFDDGLYAAAKLLELVSKESRDLAAIFAALPESEEVVEINLPVPEKVKFKLIKALEQKGDFDGANLNTIDGIRAEFNDGWFLARPSNTTSNLVIKFEADNAMVLERLKSILRSQLQKIAPKLKINF